MAGPLEGIRVLDFTTLTAGGEASGFLCDLGAEVIKVEPKQGEAGRRLTLVDGVSSFFLPQNRGKRSITLDIRTPEGREAVLRLAERCDVFMHNFRPNVMERLNLGYEDVCRVNPRVIYAESSAFGSRGPDAGLPAVDIIGQARGGIMSVTGEDYPTPTGAIMSDYTAAMHLVIGILAALLRRGVTGRGQRVEGSMLGSLISLQGWEFTHYLLTRQLPARGARGHPLLRGLWGVYETADGHLAISALPPGKVDALADALGEQDLKRSPYRDAPRDPEAVAHMRSALANAFRQHKTAGLIEVLVDLEVPCSPVQDYEQLAADPQVVANDYVVEVEHPRLGTVRVAGNPLRFSDTPVEIAAAAPELGEHTEALLAWAGYSGEELADLRSRGFI